MIESNIIEWLDFGDSLQKIDSYSKVKLLRIFKFCRILIKNKPPVFLTILLMIISFIQLLCLSSYFISSERRDIIIQILHYLNNYFLLSNIMNDTRPFFQLIIITKIILYLNIIIIFIIFFTIEIINLKYFVVLINIINEIIFYYYLSIIVEISIMTFLCENAQHKLLQVTCFSSKHLYYVFFSALICLLYLLISFLYSLFYNEIGSITINKNEKIIRIKCHYEVFNLICRIIIFIICFIMKIKSNTLIIRLIYIGAIFIISFIMFIYVYKYIYYYNNIINYINYIGWFFNSWFALCIFLKLLLNINNISNSIFIGWIIIIILLIKSNKMKELFLVTESNILDFKDIKSIEMYNNILLDKLSNKKDFSSKIILYGNINNLEVFNHYYPEINYHYYKLLNDKSLNNSYDKKDDLPILSIIYIIYSIQLEKSSFKEIILLLMSYFLINRLNNPTYAMFLCSKMRTNGMCLYYKYLLTEDIKEYLTNKFNFYKNKSLKHVQIGTIILYYLYNDLFKMKIHDGITNQIDYFDILKNNITTYKSTINFLKIGDNILKTRKEILKIWKKIIELNPFSDELYKDYMLYLGTILQDEILVREEENNYLLLKQKKYEEKNNIYHNMFLIETSSILLIDGYLSIGKILYSSPNFPLIFSYNGKEILNYTVDDLLPNVIQSFHKELMEEAIKYSNLNYRFKKQIKTFLKSKNGRLYNIKLLVKPVPNIKYGLIYFTYLQKINKNNIIIILDKDFKISGFTEMDIGSNFTMGIGYNLNYNLCGSHIGLIIPDILPLLKYKNNEFYINKNILEQKGYLYQINSLSEIKSRVNTILEKIKINNKIMLLSYEDALQNISKEFNDLILELNKQNIKPFSIFYKIQICSFLDNKYKYYRINICDDIITENEKGNILIKEINKDIKRSISKKSNEKIRKIKIINKENQLLKNDNNNNLVDLNNIKINNNEQNEKFKFKKEENRENDKVNNTLKKLSIKKISSNNIKIKHIDTNFNTIKMQIINGKEGFPVKLMKYINLIVGIMAIIIICYKNVILLNYFQNISNYLESNLIFNMTKMSVAVIYIMITNIKWELHNCLIEDNQVYQFSSYYEVLLKRNIKYLLEYRNTTIIFSKEYKDILEKKNDLDLHIYGYNEKENYKFNFNNLLLYLVNGVINVIESHNYLLNQSKEANYNLDPLTIWYSELLDLENQTYLYYFSDINGFTGKEKNKKIENISNIFPLVFNSIILIFLLISYFIIISKMYNNEIYFLEKIINFNSTNFEGYIKNLEDIKKKLQNENIEEEEKDDIDMNYSISYNNSKNEENKSKFYITKKIKKSKKKDPNKIGKMMKQKKNKIKKMSSFFLKFNCVLSIKIFLIVIISLSYFIISLFIEINKKNQLLIFDTINNDILSVFKQSFDIFIKFKKQLQNFEDTLEKCDIGNKELYQIKIPNIKQITIHNFGKNIMQIKSDFGFKSKTMSNFTLLFSENACKVLSSNDYEYKMCKDNFNDFLFQGMEQAISKINSYFGSIIEEIKSINTNGTNFKIIINNSKFHSFEVFIVYFYQKSIIITYEIFKDFRLELYTKIIVLIKVILLIYIIVNICLFLFLLYLLYNFNQMINSFLHFISIIPFKYLFEDEKLYKEIIKFGNNYYSK